MRNPETDTRIMVHFQQNCSPYISGEKAAFPPAEAQRLVDRKLAIYCEGVKIYKVGKQRVDIDADQLAKEKEDGNSEPATEDGPTEPPTTVEAATRTNKKVKSGKAKKRVRA